MNSKKISVCIATFNGEKYIKDQVESILCQLDEKDEIIISDDGSTDNTLDIINSFHDIRIKIFKNSFQNLILNFEFALSQAKGDFIFLSDQDDIWLSNKVEICIDDLQSYDVVISNCMLVNKDKEVIHESFFELNKSKKGLISNLTKNSYLGCCFSFRKELLTKALPFPKNIPMHDIWLGFVSELFFKVKFNDKVLMLYRRHGLNASSTGENSHYNLYRKFLFRFNIVKNIPKLYLNNWRKYFFFI